MSQYHTQQLPEFDVGPGNFQTRNARYRAFVCHIFDLKFVSVGGNGNCFFESLSLLLRPTWPSLNATELRANVVDLFRACIDSTQPVFERIIQGIELELNQELTCSRRGSTINGFKPSTVVEYIDAVAQDGVWVQGLHWTRAVSFLYDVRIAVVLYGAEFIRIVGSGDTTLFLYKTDDFTHFDPLVHSSVSVNAETPSHVTAAITDAAVIISSDDSENSVHGVHGSEPVSSESSVHGSQPVSHAPGEAAAHTAAVSSVHGSPPVPQRPRRTSRMQTRPPSPSPDPPARGKRNARARKKQLHASETDDDEPLVHLVRGSAKAPLKLADDFVLPLSTGTSFTAATPQAAVVMLKERLLESHTGATIRTRNSSETYLYLQCTSCDMWCAAGSKKGSNRWHITTISSLALEACKRSRACKKLCSSESVSVSMAPALFIPPTPSPVIPSVESPVPNFPEGPERECAACLDQFTRTTQCSQGHAWCISCFASLLEGQCSLGKGEQKFLEVRGIFCTCCYPNPTQSDKPWTFDMERLAVW